MTSLSFLTASFSAEKRCKGKHFFSFHQNFFQVFSGRFSGAVGPRHERYHPKRGKMPAFHRSEAFAPESGCKSTHFIRFRNTLHIRFRNTLHTLFLYFFDIRGKHAVKQGFTTETFWKGTSEGGKTAHLYIRAYAITFIYAAQTRRNFYPKGRKFLFGA